MYQLGSLSFTLEFIKELMQGLGARVTATTVESLPREHLHRSPHPVLRLTGHRPGELEHFLSHSVCFSREKSQGSGTQSRATRRPAAGVSAPVGQTAGTLESTQSCPEKFTVFTEQAFGCGFFKNPEFQASVYQVAYTSEFIELLRTEIHRAVQMPKSADCLRREHTLETEYDQQKWHLISLQFFRMQHLCGCLLILGGSQQPHKIHCKLSDITPSFHMQSQKMSKYSEKLTGKKDKSK